MMEEFYTRQRANEGNKLPLYYPDGTESEHYFIVRGIDSDHFRRAEFLSKRRAIEFAQIEDPVQRADAIRDEEYKCIAALVVSWSFEKECTEENVIAFLKEAPQIADSINKYSARRSLFFAKKSESSTNGPGKK